MLTIRPAAGRLLVGKLFTPPLRSRALSSSPTRFDTTTVKQSRFRASYLLYALGLSLGTAAGFTVRNFLAPLSFPVPGSQADELALDALTGDIDALDIVKTMRAQGYHLHADTPLKKVGEGRRGWIELDIDRHITDSEEDKDKTTRTLTRQSMAGAQGLGIQRAFWNTDTRELIAVVWIGGALAGWPGIAHGGGIATLIEDAMSRTVAGPNASIDSIPIPISVDVAYVRPTSVLNFYILRASFSKPTLPWDASPPPPEPESPKSFIPSLRGFAKKSVDTVPVETVELTGTLESLRGEVTVRAKAIYPASAIKA
ncbi:hypothetical protein P154DRAFT_425170 [Amniculicola lignicola CBS 123094]|uniref:Thioesterase domain-containing protein n=1 Tax=Amniculicola lignicola CBS 123094 TaxID=1392246 RepID=A0A6A5X2E5_9PLEO|nr:hypothetical protein P154DRAFT_425170 [Amniculicola lignicola CBS 123094]